MRNNFNFYFFFIIIFIIGIIIEGIYYHYYYFISELFEFLPINNQSGYNPLIWSENGLVENIQILTLLISIFLFIKFIWKKKLVFINSKVIFYLYLFGISYYFFEEISWGQHFFGWDTPNFFSDLNQQDETNLHNISNLFNELPRHFLTIWCILPLILFKIPGKLNLDKNIKLFVLPNKNLKKLSFLILIFYLPDFVVDKFGLYPGHPAGNIIDQNINFILDIVTFNFIRLSELHEQLFNIYILFHSYYLNKLSFSPVNDNLNEI